jgi:hypothetical protein
VLGKLRRNVSSKLLLQELHVTLDFVLGYTQFRTESLVEVLVLCSHSVNLSFSFEVRQQCASSIEAVKQAHLTPDYTLIAFGVRFLPFCFQERLDSRKEGVVKGRTCTDEATPCLLLETLGYPVVSQLVRGIVCGWGNSEERHKTKRRGVLVSELSLLTPPPPPPFILFVHPLGARSIVDGG